MTDLEEAKRRTIEKFDELEGLTERQRLYVLASVIVSLEIISEAFEDLKKELSWK